MSRIDTVFLMLNGLGMEYGCGCGREYWEEAEEKESDDEPVDGGWSPSSDCAVDSSDIYKLDPVDLVSGAIIFEKDQDHDSGVVIGTFFDDLIEMLQVCSHAPTGLVVNESDCTRIFSKIKRHEPVVFPCSLLSHVRSSLVQPVVLCFSANPRLIAQRIYLFTRTLLVHSYQGSACSKSKDSGESSIPQFLHKRSP